MPGYAVSGECHPSFDPFCSAQLIQSLSSPLQNGSDTSAGADATADQLDKTNACQLPPQAQSQSLSQAPVPQLPSSQRALSASASSCLTQQKQRAGLAGAAGQAPTETSAEVQVDN